MRASRSPVLFRCRGFFDGRCDVQEYTTWAVCRGIGYSGETCCPAESRCVAYTSDYSTCVPSCANEDWTQCWGEGFKGDSCCQADASCSYPPAHPTHTHAYPTHPHAHHTLAHTHHTLTPLTPTPIPRSPHSHAHSPHAHPTHLHTTHPPLTPRSPHPPPLAPHTTTRTTFRRYYSSTVAACDTCHIACYIVDIAVWSGVESVPGAV